jgi:hypothetical protein
MVQSKAKTVEEYLENLPEDRRAEIAKVRDVVLKNLPVGYVEGMGWGMITYGIPLEVFPDTYNKQPLGVAALAAQKNYCAIYLMCVYGAKEINDWFNREWKKSGKKLDMGKSCVRFRKADDLALDVIGKAIAMVPPEKLIAAHEKVHAPRRKK